MARIDHGDNRIVHLHYDTRERLCSDFVRLQEFYESPFDDIRGHFFTLDQFKERYSADRGGFTYFTDWSGFNVPGNVVIEFRDKFYAGMREEEWGLLFSIDKDDKFVYRRDPNFYVIGTFGRDPEKNNTVNHELAHAYFYLYPAYKAKQLAVIETMNPETLERVSQKILNMGYDQSVIYDEVQAYLGTGFDEAARDFFELDDEDMEVKRRLEANFKEQKAR